MTDVKRLLLLCCAVLLFSCKKEDPAPPKPEILPDTELEDHPPANPDKINGHLYLSKVAVEGSSSYPYSNAAGYAAFRDPATSLFKSFSHFFEGSNANTSMGSVRVGNVFAGNQMFQDNGSFYRLNSSYGTLQPNWRTDGNKSFFPLNITVKRGYPEVVLTNTFSPTLSRSTGWHMNTADLAKNFDSLIVWVSHSGSLPTIVAGVGRNATSLGFTAAQISELDNYSNTFYLIASNYSTIRINGKVYVFELATKQTYYPLIAN